MAFRPPRQLTALLVFLLHGCATAAPARDVAGDHDAVARSNGLLGAIEARYGGRLGISALDTGTGRRISHRGGERFAMASTFKWLLAAAIVERVDAGTLRLQQSVAYTRADLLDPAPVTEGRSATNDVALAWPPGRPPIVIAAHLDASPRPLAERKQALVEAASIVAQELGPPTSDR